MENNKKIDDFEFSFEKHDVSTLINLIILIEINGYTNIEKLGYTFCLFNMTYLILGYRN